jgi:site-specific DNA recombinase
MDIREITPIETLINRETKKKNVCAYARVSTLKDVSHMSFDTQVQTYTKMILERSDWNFIGVYSDEGKSGTNTHKRTQFSTMIDMAKSGLIDLIITKSISRFSRNVIDTISILQELRNCDVEVWFENENISSFDPKIEFVISVLSGMAEEEARNVSENVKWNVRKRFSEGKFFLVTKGFLGYAYSNKGELVVDEAEAAVVKKIYELYTSGTGVSKIIEYLNDNKIKTTYNKGKWYGNAVYNILKNEKYTGNALLQKTVRPSFKAKLKVKNETLPMYYVEDSHPPIINQELFDKAQEIRKGQIDKFHHTSASIVDKDKYNKHSKYKGLLKCPYCGKSYIQRVGLGKTEYSKSVMMCPANKMRKTCMGDNISSSILEQAVINQLNYIIRNKSNFLNLVFKAVETNPQRLTLIQTKEDTEAKISEFVAKNETIKHLDDDFHLNVRNEIKEELIKLRIEVSNINNLLATIHNPDRAKQAVNSDLLSFIKDKDYDALLSNLIESITVSNKSNLIFKVKHVEKRGDIKTETHEVKYTIRKTENRLEHFILL